MCSRVAQPPAVRYIAFFGTASPHDLIQEGGVEIVFEAYLPTARFNLDKLLR